MVTLQKGLKCVKEFLKVLEACFQKKSSYYLPTTVHYPGKSGPGGGSYLQKCMVMGKMRKKVL